MCGFTPRWNRRQHRGASLIEEEKIEFIFVRHGRTAWNSGGRFQGRSDVPLSDEGRAQARALSAALRHVPFTRAYSSDLGRALETARTIAKPHRVRLETDERLREFDFGEWEGLTWDEIVAKWPELAEQPLVAARLYRPNGGETYDAVVERVRAFFDALKAGPMERILIVAHAGTLHAAIEALRVLAPGPLSFSTASITRVAMKDGKARLISLNDVSHLDSAS